MLDNNTLDNNTLDDDIFNMIESYDNCKYYTNCLMYGALLVNQNNEIIQNFPDYFINHSKITLQNINIYDAFLMTIEEDVFFSYYGWGYNYQINYIEILPNVFFYAELIKKNKNILFACIGIYKNFYTYIFDLLNIDTSKIILIHMNTKFKHIYVSKFSKKYFNGCKKLSKYNFLISDIIRNKLTEKFKDNININKNKLIYINRLNNMAGYNRFIYNNDDVVKFIKEINFQTITFENMTIEQKFLSTLNSKIVISPIGANLTNFFFSKNDNIELFILLVPKVNNDYITFNLIQLTELGKIDENKIKLLYCEVIKNGVSEDPVNNPYIVNLLELKEILHKYMNNDVCTI